MTSPAAGATPSVDPQEAMELLGGDALLVDVRDAREWAAGHPRHAIHIPLDEVSSSTPYTTRTRRVIVLSRSGRRAREAVVHLRVAGVDAVVLQGGLRAWVDAGGELVADDGREPRIVAPRRTEEPGGPA